MKHLELFENYSSISHMKPSPYRNEEEADRDFDMLIAKAKKDENGDLQGEEFYNILKFFIDKFPENVIGRHTYPVHIFNRLNYEHGLRWTDDEEKKMSDRGSDIYRNLKDKEQYVNVSNNDSWKKDNIKNYEERYKAMRMFLDWFKSKRPPGEQNVQSYSQDPTFKAARDAKYKSYIK